MYYRRHESQASLLSRERVYAVYGCQVHLNQGILVSVESLPKNGLTNKTNDDHHAAPHRSSPAISIPFPLTVSHVALLEGK
jgi:hypothetical protein